MRDDRNWYQHLVTRSMRRNLFRRRGYGIPRHQWRRGNKLCLTQPTEIRGTQTARQDLVVLVELRLRFAVDTVLQPLAACTYVRAMRISPISRFPATPSSDPPCSLAEVHHGPTPVIIGCLATQNVECWKIVKTSSWCPWRVKGVGSPADRGLRGRSGDYPCSFSLHLTRRHRPSISFEEDRACVRACVRVVLSHHHVPK